MISMYHFYDLFLDLAVIKKTNLSFSLYMSIPFVLFLFFLILLEGVYISPFVITKKTKTNFELINLTTSCTAHVKYTSIFSCEGKKFANYKKI